MRKKAEEIVKNQIDHTKDKSWDLDNVIYELRVNQTELEMQNEELRTSQIKLENLNHKYFDLYNYAPVGYFTLNKNGLILDVNLAGSELLGTERANLQNKAFIQYINPEDRNKFHHHTQEILKTGTKDSLELKLITSDNKLLCSFLEIASIQYDNQESKGFKITVTNITNLKKTEKALKESENYREIFFNDHTVMMLIDPFTGDIIDANLAASNFYGYDRDKLIKMNIRDINATDADSVIKEMQKAISKQQNYFIFKHRLSDGEIRDVDVCSGLINQKGKELLYSIVN